jgi:hypothetical protein
MSTDEMLRELVTGARQLTAALLPLLQNPAELFSGLGPMGAVLGRMLTNRQG